MKKKIIYLALLIIGIIYYSTTSRTLLPNGDSGELVTTAFFGGIAHPPGYPLYNLIGHLFLKLPISGEPAFRLNLLSAIFHILCLLFVYKSFLLLTNNKYFLSVLMVFALAFSYSFWLYSGVAEVFALHSLLFSILFFLFLKIYFSKKKNEIIKLSLFWSFVFGLGMSNNHLIVLILPAFTFLLYKKNTKYKYFESIFSKIIMIAKLFLCFIIGFLPYLYFFWAKNNINPMTWIYPDNFKDVIRIFFRLNYGDFLNYHDYGFVDLQVKTFITNVLTEIISIRGDFWLFSLLLPVSLFFLLFIIRKMKTLRFCFALMILPFIFLMIVFKIGLYNYSFSVFERLFLCFHIVLIFVVAFFLSCVLDLLKNKTYLRLCYLILFFLTFFLFFVNFKKVNQKNNYICKNFYNDVVRTVPEDSITLIEGDIQTFCFTYYHYVLGNYKRDKRIFVFANYFLMKNDGTFLKQNNIKKFSKMEDLIDPLRNNQKKIYYLGSGIPAGLLSEQQGVLYLVYKNKKKIDYEKIYQFNSKWFNNSKVLMNYDESFVNLSNRTLKEFYCGEYLKSINYFLDAKKNEYAKKIFIDFNHFCQADDFSVPASANIDLNRVKARFPFVTR